MNKEETKPVATSSLGYGYPRLGLFTHYGAPEHDVEHRVLAWPERLVYGAPPRFDSTPSDKLSWGTRVGPAMLQTPRAVAPPD